MSHVPRAGSILARDLQKVKQRIHGDRISAHMRAKRRTATLKANQLPLKLRSFLDLPVSHLENVSVQKVFFARHMLNAILSFIFSISQLLYIHTLN